jgi:hypothetical protein
VSSQRKVEWFGSVLALTTDVVAGSEEADVEVVTGVDVVLGVVVAGDDDVIAGIPVDDVVVETAGHGVLAAVTDRGVHTGAAVEIVVTGIAPDGVVPVATGDGVVTGRAADQSPPPAASMTSSPSEPMMSWSGPSRRAGPYWPEASSQVWLAGRYRARRWRWTTLR